MQNIVRAFVVVLALTGAAASAHMTVNPVSASSKVSKMSAMPKPCCPPDNPAPCF